jgi:hypothetical protein
MQSFSSFRQKRLISWSLAFAAIVGFSLLKATENARDVREQEQWRGKVELLAVESGLEAERLMQWIQSLNRLQAAKQQLQNELNGGKPFVLQNQGVYEVATWRHPQYGFAAEFTFFKDKVVSYGYDSGWSHVGAVHPQPPPRSLHSYAEYMRRLVPWLAVSTWIAALFVWIWRVQLRPGAAEVMLMASLACGAAWFVDPKYAATQIRFDYRLGMALLMAGLAVAARLSVRLTVRQIFRFNLRFLLSLTICER